MWGMIAKITTAQGKRDEMILLLQESARDLPGCLSYIVAKDSTDENLIWVNETWESQVSHDASLSLPQVRNAVSRSKPLAAGFERIATTEPVWESGLLPNRRER